MIYLLMILYLSVVESSHFYGGTITWKPLNNINNTDTNETISVMFTQSYQWRQSQTHCDATYVSNQSPKIPMNSDTLQCITDPISSCGGFIPVSVNGYCTDFSKLIDSSTSQISDIENITVGSQFCVAYKGSTWPGIQSSICGFSCYIDNGKWSLGICVDLTERSDGFINTPPVATVISPVQVPANTIFNITIPVTDVDNDILRCRWAHNTSNFDECGDICGILPGSILDPETCTLTVNSTGKYSGDFYPVALMVEDFANDSNETAMSSVPIQFLIRIIDTPSCISKPIINSSISSNTYVEVGTSFQFTLTIQSNCPGVSIIDFYRMPPIHMFKSNITFDTINNVSIVTETWTPTQDQIGTQVYCAMATDSVSIQSDLYWLTFIVVERTTTILRTTTLPPNTGTDNGNNNNNSLYTSAPDGGFCRRYCKRRTKEDDSVEATPKYDNTKNDSANDYRNEYIKPGDDNNNELNNQSMSENEKPSLTHENTLACVSISDFELNPINVTTTSFFSPSTNSLPNNDVQHTTEYSSKMNTSELNGSILIRAYSEQERYKSPQP